VLDCYFGLILRWLNKLKVSALSSIILDEKIFILCSLHTLSLEIISESCFVENGCKFYNVNYVDFVHRLFERSRHASEDSLKK